MEKQNELLINEAKSNNFSVKSNKQIDEMTKDLFRTDTCEIKKIGIPCNHRCKAHIYATRAVDKGYRKASEVALKVIDKIEIETNCHIKGISMIEPQNAYSAGAKNALYLTLEFLAELKKKYTEVVK